MLRISRRNSRMRIIALSAGKNSRLRDPSNLGDSFYYASIFSNVFLRQYGSDLFQKVFRIDRRIDTDDVMSGI